MSGSGSGRESVSLGDPDDLDGFPVWHVLRGAVLPRATAPGRGPLWFASRGSGRFDLDPPRGTCYLSDDPLVAMLELLGALGAARVVHTSVLEGALLWSLPMPRQYECESGWTLSRSPTAVRSRRLPLRTTSRIVWCTCLRPL